MASGRHAALLDELQRLAGRAAEEAGVELVEVVLKGSSRRRSLRVDIDRAGPRGTDLEDCRRVSELLGAAIEETDAIRESYLLEVSSPGLDRPIRSADDIRRNTGRRIAVSVREPMEGRRLFRGLLEGERDGCILLCDDESGEIEIPLEKIEMARQEVKI
jgi:ribosome maturation factor RimP